MRRSQHTQASAAQCLGQMAGDEAVGAGEEHGRHAAASAAMRIALAIMPSDMFLADRLEKLAELAT